MAKQIATKKGTKKATAEVPPVQTGDAELDRALAVIASRARERETLTDTLGRFERERNARLAEKIRAMFSSRIGEGDSVRTRKGKDVASAILSSTEIAELPADSILGALVTLETPVKATKKTGSKGSKAGRETDATPEEIKKAREAFNAKNEGKALSVKEYSRALGLKNDKLQGRALGSAYALFRSGVLACRDFTDPEALVILDPTEKEKVKHAPTVKTPKKGAKK